MPATGLEFRVRRDNLRDCRVFECPVRPPGQDHHVLFGVVDVRRLGMLELVPDWQGLGLHRGT